MTCDPSCCRSTIVRLHRLDGQTIDQIIESFRFLEPAATDFRDANSLVQFSSQDDGYQLTIPAGWIEVPVPSLDGAPTPGVQRFESGTDHPYGALTISVGQADETLVVCKPDCEEADGIESVADLRAAIHDLEQTVHETPYGLIRTQPTGSVVRGAATLGGEVAEYQRPQAVIDRQAAAYHVYALHDGRPVLLSFGLTSYARVSEIIDSFRFTD